MTTSWKNSARNTDESLLNPQISNLTPNENIRVNRNLQNAATSLLPHKGNFRG